jgi:hypothetical protein
MPQQQDQWGGVPKTERREHPTFELYEGTFEICPVFQECQTLRCDPRGDVQLSKNGTTRISGRVARGLAWEAGLKPAYHG